MGPAACVLGVVLLAVAAWWGLARGPGPAAVTGQTPIVNRGTVPANGDTPATGAAASPSPTAGSAAVVAGGSRLRLARLGVDAAIMAVSAPGLVLQVPDDPQVLGWWSGGSAPGNARGTVVIDGHINFNGVSGALAVLPRTRPGDVVTIHEPAATYRYVIHAVRTYPKSTGIPAEAFDRVGRARLVLITCGGPFDPSTGNYRDNIVAYAVPGG